MRRAAIVLGIVVLCLAAARVAVPGIDHRAPCHLTHRCPSDHHSYVWYDAAGQGWDCAEPGAPEVTAADTQSLYVVGRRYLCHRAGGAQAPTCGVEAWAEKTLSDPAALRVDYAPHATTIGALSALRPPGNLGTRMPGAEMHTWRLRVKLLQQKLESDSDVHLVIADPRTGATMIAELPAAGCVGAAAAPRAAMAAARAALLRYCGPATTRFTRLTGTATIEGVVFFDFPHGQRGGAPNHVELHPVVRLSRGQGRC